MDNKLFGLLSLIGVIIFVTSAILFSSKVQGQRKMELQREFENKFQMFKALFSHSSAVVKQLNSPILTLKRSKNGRFILPVFLCCIFIVIALFYRGALNVKIIMLTTVSIWFVWCAIKTTSYVIVYSNAFVHGNIIKKTIVWFDKVDSIEARLYDYNGVMDANQAQVYRVYEVKQKDKVVFGIWETEFPNARMLETCFDTGNPLVSEVIESSL
ncbi:hypothetical protein [Lacrimispora brassicae]